MSDIRKLQQHELANDSIRIRQRVVSAAMVRLGQVTHILRQVGKLLKSL